MRKHYVLKNKKRFYITIITLTIIMSSFLFASSVYGYDVKQFDTVTVEKGDTLWTIAQKYNNSGDIRKLIFEIKKANKLESSIIYAGDELLVPKM
ncbi:MAG: hypothetical protein A2Y21_04230 [Clostridiales bacterium GWC2_40_7]|nr:MAG: hypothetical protein A2Y21_04230 [Clostridiales bacterium GWC2_40_7]